MRIAGSRGYISRMRWILLPLILSVACGASEDDLCARFYAPFPNHIGDRPRTNLNASLLDGMAAYDRKDFVEAAEHLGASIAKDASDHTTRMYLASALLGAGEPYKAEMHLDFLERVRGAGFKDQVDWYNSLCWLCSGQFDRALSEATRIAAQPAHTYKAEARALSEALTER